MFATVVGYAYRAEILCPYCTASALGIPDSLIAEYGAGTVIDVLATARGIDAEDERSFDSNDFPKVVFESDVDGEFCGVCLQTLVSQ